MQLFDGHDVIHYHPLRAEDVAVPFEVLTALLKLIAPEQEASKKTSMLVRSSVATLLNYNLLKGSISQGMGVFMHGLWGV